MLHKGSAQYHVSRKPKMQFRIIAVMLLKFLVFNSSNFFLELVKLQWNED